MLKCVQIELECGLVGFLRRGETGVPEEKSLGARERTNNRTHPTYGVSAEIQTQATLVGGECSHHCTTITTHCFESPTYLVAFTQWTWA